MASNNIIGLLSTLALFMPVLFILIFRLGIYRSFPALFVYYLLVFAYNLFVLQYIPVNKSVVHYVGTTNNFLDTPLMLFFISYLAVSKPLCKAIRVLTVIMLVFTAIMIAIFGYNITTSVYVLGPGMLFTLGLTAYFSWLHIKIAVRRPRTMGKAIISCSLLFSYGCYALLYVVHYMLQDEHTGDSFLVYYTATLLGSGFLAAGVYFESRRVKRLRELKVTRRELSQLYGETSIKKTTSLEAVLFPHEQFSKSNLF